MNFIEKYCVRIAALAGIVAFIPILGAGFVYDDLELLRDNLSLRRWSFLWEGFLQPMWDMAADPRKQAGGFYRPVGSCSRASAGDVFENNLLPTFVIASAFAGTLFFGILAAERLGYSTQPLFFFTPLARQE